MQLSVDQEKLSSLEKKNDPIKELKMELSSLSKSILFVQF
jgi:hypothetical protein